MIRLTMNLSYFSIFSVFDNIEEISVYTSQENRGIIQYDRGQEYRIQSVLIKLSSISNTTDGICQDTVVATVVEVAMITT